MPASKVFVVVAILSECLFLMPTVKQWGEEREKAGLSGTKPR